MKKSGIDYVKLGDITDDHPLMQDVFRDAKTKEGEEFGCIRCKTPYKRGSWDFYSLCPACFAKFDEQKMNGRFGVTKTWFESPQKWMASEEKEK